MRTLGYLFFMLTCFQTQAQLEFCSGSKGDPIFHEDFGNGSGTGNELSSGITNYRYIGEDPQDGEYTISDDIGAIIGSWHQYLPQTNVSGGRALIVNADFTAGRFYKKEISGLCENTTYEFSAFLMNVYNRASNICENGGIPNNVRFEIWDESDTVLLRSGDTGDIISTSTPQWKQYGLTFRSQPGQTSIILKMFNNGEGGCGNDLAIDDIIFRSCGDLTTITSEGDSNGILQVCEENSPVSVQLQANADSSVYEQQFYQWQISPDAENWGNIPGANSSTYQTSLIDSSVFFRVKVAEEFSNLANSFCSSASEAFKVEVIPSPNAPQSEGDQIICANEPIPALRVTVSNAEKVSWYDAETGGNLLADNTNTYFPLEEGVYYAEAKNAEFNCDASSRTAVRLTINELPDLQDENLKICPDSTLELNSGVTGYNYLWNNGETTQSIIVNSPGNYSVEIISAEGCFITKDFEVSPIEIAGIAEVVSEEDFVEIIPIVEGDFLYSIDGSNYQNSPVFNEIQGGIYTAYITDSEACIVDSEIFAHIVIPGMISPNNDGYNDNFELRGVEFFERSEIRIFDRYGKLLKMGQGQGFKWNGKWNDIDLPADDYWYQITISGFEPKTGHFSLIR